MVTPPPPAGVKALVENGIEHSTGIKLARNTRNEYCMLHFSFQRQRIVRTFVLLLDFSLTVKAATLIFISGCSSAISSAKEGKSGFIYNLVKS